MPKTDAHRIRTVLVVDDRPDQTEVMADLLRAEGFETSSANSGPQALFQVAQGLPDAMLMDIDMPGMTGIQLARELKARGYATSMRLIAVTGHGLPADRRATAEAGFELHLSKPVDIDALLCALRQPL